MGPVLFTFSINVFTTLTRGTNYTEPGRTAHKRGTNKNNLVPSEVRSSKLVRFQDNHETGIKSLAAKES